MKQDHAFTLVELSIVLVILGLLVGGVLTGQSLIRAAELRSLMTQAERYLAATHTFRDKYFALPGDMTNATTYWGSLGGTGSDTTCQAIASTSGTATCNGDGDGSMLFTFGSTTYTNREGYRYWQHLANAGLIEGSYTGVSSGGMNTNSGSTKMSNVFWMAQQGLGYSTPGGNSYFSGTNVRFSGDYGKNMFYLARTGANTSSVGSQPLTPEDAYNIDKKSDDGMPGTGLIVAGKGDNGVACASNAGSLDPTTDATATYALSNKARDCWFYYVRIF